MYILPEGLALPSVLSLAIQVSNVFMISYLVYITFSQKERGKEPLLVFAVLGTGFVGVLLLAVFWSYTVPVNGLERCVPLITLSFVCGGANTMSSVVFLPIVSSYPLALTTAFALGEASTGLISSLIALIQDFAGFSPTVYFCIIGGIMIISSLAYAMLRFHSIGRIARENTRIKVESSPSLLHSWTDSFKIVWLELLITMILNFMESGALTSILSYCVQPYGSSFYKGALWGGMIASPIGTLITLFARFGHPLIWSSIWFPLCCFFIVNSCIPILTSSTAFGVFVVLFVIVARFLIGYTKALLYYMVQGKTKRGMFLVGVSQQIGASIGSLLFFLLINYTQMYKN